MNSILTFTVPHLGEITLRPMIYESTEEDCEFMTKAYRFQLKELIKPAMEAYRRGLVKDLYNTKMLNNLAGCCLIHGDIRNARIFLDKIQVSSEPRIYNLVICDLTSLRFKEGLDSLVNIFKQREEYYLLRGILLYKLNRYSDSIRDLLEYSKLTHQTSNSDQLLSVISKLDRNLDRLDRRMDEFTVNRSVTPLKARKVKSYISRVAQISSLKTSGSLQVLRSVKLDNNRSYKFNNL